MIISRTPFRVSFFGGGTDYPAWFREHGGQVLTSTINKYCYISARYLPPFFEYRNRIVWSRIETINDTADIQHPVVRAGLDWLGLDRGVEIHHNGDLPARSGIGSSSAFTVGFLHAIHGLKSTLSSKQSLAEQAIELEQNILQENVGIQDQIGVAFGGINRIDIRSDGSFSVQPLMLPADRVAELESNLMLLFTGVSRYSDRIAKDQINAIPDRKPELDTIGALVDRAIEVLTGSGSLAPFGTLMHEGWEMKRRIADSVSTELVDDIYARARAAGALGGKLLGAGGGGFMMMFVPPARRAAVRRALAEFLEIPFRFEFSGSQIIFCEPEDDNPRED